MIFDKSFLRLHASALKAVVLVRLVLAALMLMLCVEPSAAVPSFVKQTGQPCAACHVGAFGPQLKPFGRDFKLRGYTSTDGQDESLRLAVIAMTSFTGRDAAPGTSNGRNDLTLNPASVYYAGKLFDRTGAFISTSYDPVSRQLQLGKFDVRHVREVRVFDRDLLVGITVNNNPGLQDVWNSLPAFGFPFVRSTLAPRGKASTLFDGRLRGRVLGASLYAVWDDFLQLESGLYEGLTANMLEATGKIPATGVDRPSGTTSYSRLSLNQAWGGHFAQVGTFALTGNIIPRGVPSFGFSNRYVDVGLDANYQYILNPGKTSSDMLSASALYIRETAKLAASQFLRNARPDGELETFRTNLSYSFAATITPSVQYFRTTGTRDPEIWATANGRPDTDGMVYEVAYSPWGKPESPSPIPGLNARLTLQYTDFFHFDGTRLRARSNNSIFIGLQTGLAL